MEIKSLTSEDLLVMKENKQNIFNTNNNNEIDNLFKNYVESFYDLSKTLKDATLAGALSNDVKSELEKVVVNIYNLKEIINEKDENIERIFQVQSNEKDYLGEPQNIKSGINYSIFRIP